MHDEGLMFEDEEPSSDLKMLHPAGRVKHVWFYLVPKMARGLIESIPHPDAPSLADPRSIELLLVLAERLSSGQLDMPGTKRVLYDQLDPASLLFLHQALEWLDQCGRGNPAHLEPVVEAGHLVEVAVQGYARALSRLAGCDPEDDEDD